MSLEIVPASSFSDEALAACFTAAFDGYIAGSFAMNAAALPRFLARQGADRALGRCVVRGGELLGLAFVGQYASRRRVGGMGLAAQARGSGASRLLLQRVIDEARAAGLDAVELEVFAQNMPALKLYRAMGFIDGPPLWGFSREPGAPLVAAPAVPRVVDTRAAADWLLAHGPADLPYQVSGHALRHADPGGTAWRFGQALLLFSEAAEGRLSLPLLVDADPAQRDAARLLATLIESHPAHTIRVPQLMRDDVAGRALREAGFVPLELNQIQMHLPLR